MSAPPVAVVLMVAGLLVTGACTSPDQPDDLPHAEAESSTQTSAATSTTSAASTTPSTVADEGQMPRFQLATRPDRYVGPVVDISRHDEQLVLYMKSGHEQPPDYARGHRERISVLTLRRERPNDHAGYAVLGELTVRGDKRAVHILASGDPDDPHARGGLLWHERPGIVVEVWAYGDRALLETLAADVVEVAW